MSYISLWLHYESLVGSLEDSFGCVLFSKYKVVNRQIISPAFYHRYHQNWLMQHISGIFCKLE